MYRPIARIICTRVQWMTNPAGKWSIQSLYHGLPAVNFLYQGRPGTNLHTMSWVLLRLYEFTVLPGQKTKRVRTSLYKREDRLMVCPWLYERSMTCPTQIHSFPNSTEKFCPSIGFEFHVASITPGGGKIVLYVTAAICFFVCFLASHAAVEGIIIIGVRKSIRKYPIFISFSSQL
jgi:hypothetical protein